jgi:hypothetical protein
MLPSGSRKELQSIKTAMCGMFLSDKVTRKTKNASFDLIAEDVQKILLSVIKLILCDVWTDPYLGGC